MSEDLQALVKHRTGSEGYIYGLRVGGELGRFTQIFGPDYPVVLKEGERLILEQRGGDLTLYRELD